MQTSLVKEYSKFFLSFLNGTTTNESVALFAKELGICRLVLNKKDVRTSKCEEEIIFQDGEGAGPPAVYVEPFSGGIIYSVLAFPKERPWNQEEMAEAEGVCRLLFSLNTYNRQKKLLEYKDFHDMDTGVYTTPYAVNFIQSLVNRSIIQNYAIVFFNINNMGGINALIGRDNATFAMKNLTVKINSLLQKEEVLWRLGGDNFALAIQKERLPSILRVLKGEDVSYSEHPTDIVHLSCTAGVYNCTEHTKGMSVAIDGALASMNLARFTKHVPVFYYDDQTGTILEQNKKIESEFDEGIEKHEFVPYFQPKVSLKTRTLVGAELLTRWHKNGTVRQPGIFIPVLERSARICTLDFYMLDCLCRNIRAWLDKGYELVPISTNFSRKHLVDAKLSQKIISKLDEYKVPHEFVVIEVTETTNENDARRLKDLVITLKDNGINCSVDDFGVGYSSMSLIRDVPFSDLKIDKSFLDFASRERSRNGIMMHHVISMANELGMSCIAEGAETKEQINFLEEIGCYKVQGWYFDKALSKDFFEERLQNKIYRV